MGGNSIPQLCFVVTPAIFSVQWEEVVPYDLSLLVKMLVFKTAELVNSKSFKNAFY